MDLLNVLMAATGSDNVQKLGSQFGLDSSAMEKVMKQVVPALGSGMKTNAQKSGGLDGLAGALQSGGHQKYLDNIEEALSQSGVQDGKGILGHVLGNKAASRELAAQAASSSGVSSDLIKQMLPVLATMAMGALSKQTDGGAKLSTAGQGGGIGDILGSLLDSDGDGSAMNDVREMAKLFF